MTFENITTPAELINFNNQPTEADIIMERLMDAGVIIGHEVTLRLVEANIDLHKKQLLERCEAEKPDPVEMILWTRDLQQLETALAILKEIDLGTDNDEDE